MKQTTHLLATLSTVAFVWACSLSSDQSSAGGHSQPPASEREVILFDFGSHAAVSGWRSVNDTVMGGVSTSRMTPAADGSAVFAGTISLENNGGFASVRGPRISQALREFEGIALRIRGDGKKYKAGLRTDDLFDGVFHQAGFTTKNGQWQVLKIPFTDFVPTYHGRRLSDDKRLNPQDIRSMSLLIADQQEGPFRLAVAWIKAYR